MKKDPLGISGMHNGATPNIFKNAAKLRKSMTEAEVKLWEYLRTKPHGFKFRRQHPIGFYILDFYCHQLRLSIEIDGGYHLNKEQKEKDVLRTAYLTEIGITEIRITNNQVFDNFSEVTDILSKKIAGGLPFRD